MKKNVKLVAVSLVLLVVCLAATQVTASAIYYRMENGGTSQDNSPTVDLTLGSTAGFSTDVPGTQIQDGIGGAIYANNYSYDHGTGTASTTTDYSVARAAVDSAAGFTIECFVKIDEGATAAQLLKWDTIVGSDSWSLSLNANQLPQFRAVTPKYPDEDVDNATGYLISNAGTLSEGEWHHIAVVGTVVDLYPPTWTLYEAVTLYVDYQPVGTKQFYSQAGMDPQFPRFVWSDVNTYVGAINPFNAGLLDEIRISDVALAPDGFLQAVPEPATISLLVFGAIGLVRRKR